MRYAIYFTPAKDDPLTRIATRWLGRDPFTGETSAPPAAAPLAPAEVAFHTAAARRYGFHATLKAPFALAEGESEASLIDALSAFADSCAPTVVPRATLGRLDGFFALVPDAPCPALDALAADVVTGFERFRAPLSPAEIERRNPDRLDPLQLKNLHRWGYPHVFEAFRFHMTLTGRVAAAERERVERALRAFLGGVLGAPLGIDGLALFVEPEPGAPFRVKSYHGFGRAQKKKTA